MKKNDFFNFSNICFIDNIFKNIPIDSAETNQGEIKLFTQWGAKKYWTADKKTQVIFFFSNFLSNFFKLIGLFKNRLEQRKQEEEYDQHLIDMGKKIESRKLQIEQIDEENKRKALEKKYKEVLRKAGIDETELRRK